MNSLFEQGENGASGDERLGMEFVEFIEFVEFVEFGDGWRGGGDTGEMSRWLKHHSEHITRGHNAGFGAGLIGVVSMELCWNLKTIHHSRIK